MEMIGDGRILLIGILFGVIGAAGVYYGVSARQAAQPAPTGVSCVMFPFDNAGVTNVAMQCEVK